ncbi:hypothetical protein [Brevibacillus brevis]|nr:hypothetical protein [Brevibacillus brevis]
MFNHILKDIGERGTALSFDLGERPQFLFTGPEWKMEDGMKLDAVQVGL